MFFTKGYISTREAKIHAPGSPAQTAKNDNVEAFEEIAPPFTIVGKKEQINVRAVSSAMPAARTKPGLHTPCTALLTVIKKPSIK